MVHDPPCTCNLERAENDLVMEYFLHQGCRLFCHWTLEPSCAECLGDGAKSSRIELKLSESEIDFNGMHSTTRLTVYDGRDTKSAAIFV